jgi:hypothetical protein
MKLVVLAFGLSLVVGPTTAWSADYLVDTGAPTSSTGLILSGAPGVLDWTQSWHAAKFTLDKDATFDSVEAWMSVSWSGDVTFAVYSAVAGLPPSSTALHSATVSLNKISPFMGWRGVFDLEWNLAAGSYWLNLEPARDSTFLGALWMKPPAPLAQYAESIRGDTWEYDPAGRDGLDQWGLRIAGTAVPEPTTWGLMILGFGAIGGGLRRRRVALAG